MSNLQSKRLRMDGNSKATITDDSSGNGDDCELLGLPMMLQIVQYMDPKDRLSFAISCKHALDQVELFCKVLLQAIETGGPNTTNTSFQERIRHDKSKRKLPFRLLVERAKKTFSTTFAGHEKSTEQNIGLQLSPSKTRMAIYTTSTFRVFDLASKICIANLDFDSAKESLGLDISNIFFWNFHGEGKIFFCVGYRDTICLWNFTHDLASDEERYSLLISCSTLPRTRVGKSWSISDDEIIFVKEYRNFINNSIEYVYKVMSLDTTRNQRSELAPQLLFTLQEKTYCRRFEIFRTIVGKTWLAVWGQSDAYEIYLYNLDTMEKTATWKGYLGSNSFASSPMTGSSSTSPCTHLCFLDGASNYLNMLSLDDDNGKLSLVGSYKLHDRYSLRTTRIFAVTETKLFIEFDYYGCSGYARVFDKTPSLIQQECGEMIAKPARAIHVGEGIREMAVSVAPNELYVMPLYGAVKVFLLSEPTGVLTD